MKKGVQSLFFLLFITLVPNFILAQDYDWACEYATWDDATNGTGYNTISVGVISENKFVAIVNRGSNDTYYLVGYANADSGNGRLGTYKYQDIGKQTTWSNVFDQVKVFDPYDLAAIGSQIILANNDDKGNLLVFELKDDSIYTAPLRLETGSPNLRGIDVDDNGRVYVVRTGDDATAAEVEIFDNFSNESAWTASINHQGTPLQKITLPDNGRARGVTVNNDGSQLFVSNYDSKNIYKYTGDPVNGYTLDNSFNFILNDIKIDTTSNDTLVPGPWGLQINDGVLYSASDVDFKTGSGYSYAKIFGIDPSTAQIVDTIDVAGWNYSLMGRYDHRIGGTQPGNESGYASTYYLDFDESGNLYSQSYFGWTVEKWNRTPVVGIEKTNNTLPGNFKLLQNYPNPFNPSTTIEFAIPNSSTISLGVYNITGELIKNLIDKSYYEAGNYKVHFNASRLASGMYIYRLTSENITINKKMIFLK